MSITMLVLIRSLAAFFILFFFTRLIGKQQLSQLTVFEYLVGITIGSIASAMSIELDIQSMNGIFGMAVWAVIPIAFAIIGLKSPIMRRYIQGEPRVLIRNGRIVDHNLRKERLDLDQLMMLLRQKNIFAVADVEFAIMEVNGQLSVMPKSNKRPLTASDMNLPVRSEQNSITFIKDGVVNSQALIEAGLDRTWLIGKLREQGIQDEKEVFLAQLDSHDQFFVDRKEDWRENLNPGYEHILSQFYQLHADFHQFSLLTEDEKVKKDYYKMKRQLDKMIRQVETHISKVKS
ncbi:DUF421 domain-containing protein [Ammoniphilus sp. CFH 90114]|uniref:DUF421 domain-containing protein n=1 Tax=Ammoniphilus sp. CFH 90114 TaxID=2493665 RepID=UPI0013E94F52|nr:DUF421 domain-containing protein [Ammoniphilus sp. CFH 90114]